MTSNWADEIVRNDRQISSRKLPASLTKIELMLQNPVRYRIARKLPGLPPPHESNTFIG